MDISRKTDYALRMLSTLAAEPDGVLSVRSAARENDIPYSFARAIQHDLALAGIVENTRGARGGMRLAVDPRTTTLLDVVEAVQGPVVISGCLEAAGDGPCPRRGTCHFTSVWCNAERMLRGLFASVTLHQLVVERVSPLPEGGFKLVPEDQARSLGRAEKDPDAAPEA